MKIQRIRIHQVDLPLMEGGYQWADGKSVTVFDSTVVAVEADDGWVGHGEVCPLGPAYLPAYAQGARAGIQEVGPHLLGSDPRALNDLNDRMDRALKGHPYVKSAIDMACWDLLGQTAGQPLVTLLGGRRGSDFVLYRAISQDTPEAMAERVAGYREEGYRRFQLKVGGDPDLDVERIRRAAEVLRPGDKLVADANTGWSLHEARRVARAVQDVDVYIEQPCASYEECLSVRRATSHPFILDESVDSLEMILRGRTDLAMDAVNLKLGKLGGLTRARQARDLCASLGIAMTIEDSWASDVGTAAIAHLAHSTPPDLLFSSTDFNSYVTVDTADGAPRRSQGRMAAGTEPGLGVRPRPEALGEPVAVVE